jgi:MtN3 and saliva related transmembrane protein
MPFIPLLGYIAAICTTVAFVPQVVKTYKSKSAKDLSLGMFSIFGAGVTLWMIYGILTNDLPVTLANAATLVLALLLLYFKIKFKD